MLITVNLLANIENTKNILLANHTEKSGFLANF